MAKSRSKCQVKPASAWRLSHLQSAQSDAIMMTTNLALRPLHRKAVTKHEGASEMRTKHQAQPTISRTTKMKEEHTYKKRAEDGGHMFGKGSPARWDVEPGKLLSHSYIAPGPSLIILATVTLVLAVAATAATQTDTEYRGSKVQRRQRIS